MFEFRKNRLAGACAVLVLGCLGAAAAQADSLPPGPVTLLDHTQLVGGGFSTALDFLVPAAGTVTVELKDLVWPDTLSALSFAATSVTSMFASLSAPGELSFDVNTPGHYFAIICGQTQGAFNLGLYSLSMHWTAATAGAPAVPLPAAGWLLFSGAAGLFGLARRRNSGMHERVVATV